jgi:hypothetical protein
MGDSGYERIEESGPESYFNVNPYSDQTFGQLQGSLGYGQSLMNQGIQGFNETNNFRETLGGQPGFTASGSADPMAFWNAYTNQVPYLQNIAEGALSPLNTSVMNRANQAAGDAIQNVASQFSNMGALNSGATVQAASQEANKILQDAQNRLSSQQIGLSGNLLNNAMGNIQSSFGRGQALGANLAQQRAANQLNLAGMGAGIYNTGLGNMAAFGGPQFSQYDYEYNQGPGDQFLNFAGNLGGAALGGLTGGMSNALGASLFG